MEHFDTESSDQTGTALLNENSSENLFATPGKSTSTNQGSSAYSSDLFVDAFSSSPPSADQCLSTKHENDMFFTLDDTTEESSVWAHDRQASLTLAKDKGSNVEEVSASSSLFDDLLDFSSPRTSETDHTVLDSTADAKPVPRVDLLFGVDDDLVSPTGFQPEVKEKAPDILDFVDVSCELPEITNMDVTDGSAYGSLTGDWDLLADVSSSKPSLDQSPDIVATYPGHNAVHDTTDDDEEEANEVTLAEQKKDETEAAGDKQSDAEKYPESTSDKQSDAEKHPESASDKQSDGWKHTESVDETEPITEVDVKEKEADFKEKTVQIHISCESDKMKDSLQDMDFSVLELPGASNLNFDHFKHKRSISQKGSIANRKKPKRATIQPTDEDSIFLDSTEPKSQKPQDEDVPDSGLSLDHSKGDKAKETSGQLSEETSPTRRIAGGIKIPGLLEGLSKSKVFAKAEKTSPVAEPESKPELVKPTPAADTEAPTSNQSSVTSPAVESSAPLIRPKPVVLPRVLPKPATKTLKESHNQITASSIVARASSFRSTTSASGIVEKPSLLASPVALSRSASVKVTPVSTNTDVELSSVKEEKSPFILKSKLVPPKPELKKPLSPAALRSVNKIPPPVPVKPSVAAKPGRASLGWSASFSGGKSPLLPALKSEIKTEVKVNEEQKSDSDLIVKAEKKSDSTNVVSTEKSVSRNKLLSSGFSGERKPLTFVEKKIEVVTASEKTDTTVDIVNSASGESATSKNATVNRILSVKASLPSVKTSLTSVKASLPSVKASLPSGFVPRIGFRAEENYASVEAKKTKILDTDDVFDTIADKSVSSVSTHESSNSIDKVDSPNNLDEILHRRKSSITGVNPVKSPLTSDKFPSSAMPRKGSITGSAYNPIGFRSTLGSSDSDQRSRTSSVSSSVEGAILAPEPANLLLSTASPSPKPRTGSDVSSEDQKSTNGSFITAADEKVRTSPDKFLEGSSEKTKSETVPETKLISSMLPNKGDEKIKDFIDANNDNQKPPRALRESTSPGQLNGGPAAGRGGQVSDKSTSPWNVQLKKVEKKESPKPEPAVKTEDSQPVNWRQQLSVRQKSSVPPAVKTEDSQPVNWRQQLSVRQKSSVPPKISEKPKQDSTPEWAKASTERRHRLIESGVIRSDL